MIVLNLACDADHHFEGWFASSDTFAAQQEKGLVSCPVCGSTHVSRQPTAPYVQTRSSTAPAKPAGKATTVNAPTTAALAELMRTIRVAAQSAEDVGDDFAQEARRIHQGEAEERGIKGKTSPNEMRELLEEGISVLPVPPDDKDLH